VPQVLDAIRQRAAVQWVEDVPLAFFWWSNIQMLRVFLHQLASGSVRTVGDCSWLQQALDPGLQVRAALGPFHCVAAQLSLCTEVSGVSQCVLQRLGRHSCHAALQDVTLAELSQHLTSAC
jgi:hypothetical protein